MMHTRHLCCILLMAICSMGLSCHASSLYSHPDNPYAVTHIQDAYGAHYNFHWDANGNMVHADGGKPYSDRRLCWTEDVAAQSERRASSLAFPSQSSVGAANRLQAFMERGEEGGIAAYYNYTADGERNIKFTSPRLNIQQNASQFNNPPLVYPTLYASPLITLTAKGYTKHYFEEGRRICSKLGGGGLSYDATCVTGNGEVAKRSDELFWEGLKALNEHKTKPEDFKEMSLVDARGKEVDWHKKIDLDKLAMSWQLEAKLDPGKIHFIIDDNSYPAMPGNIRYENELIRELSSFGKDLIVLSPDNIRQKVFDHVVEQCKAYQGSK